MRECDLSVQSICTCLFTIDLVSVTTILDSSFEPEQYSLMIHSSNHSAIVAKVEDPDMPGISPMYISILCTR